jgi:hypothetical protein
MLPVLHEVRNGQCSRNWGHTDPCNGLPCEWWLQSHPAATHEQRDSPTAIVYCLDSERPTSSTSDDAGANEFEERDAIVCYLT